jgi:predicted PurR-regulated permease PerM
MKREYFLIAIFIGIVVLTFYLFYKILTPFLVPFCWAGTFVIIMYPLYRKLEKWIRSGTVRSLILSFLVVLVIIGPAVYLGISLVQEAITMIDSFSKWVDAGHLDSMLNFKNTPFYQVLQTRLSPYVDISRFDPKTIVENGLLQISQIALTSTTNILANAGKVLLQFILLIFFMFYLFRDGHMLLDYIKSIIPFEPERANATINHLKNVIASTMYGGMVVAVLQGFLGGILFWCVGIHSPLFWGTLMAFTSLLPVVGTTLVYLPAGIILMLSGSVVSGIIVIAGGALVVSQVDNFIRPLLVSGKTGMHTLLLFVSVMGAVSLFGLLGTVLGPLIAAIFVTVIDMIRRKPNGNNHAAEATPAPESADGAAGQA